MPFKGTGMTWRERRDSNPSRKGTCYQGVLTMKHFIVLSNYRYDPPRRSSRMMVVSLAVGIALVVGFVLGYAARAAISAHRRRKALRREVWG